MKLPQDDRGLLAILAAIYLLSRLPLLGMAPLVQDECLYSIMVQEEARHHSLIPTFMGEPVSWKPALFFWVYGALSSVPVQMEVAYRLPSMAFGLLTVLLCYCIIRNATGASAQTAFYAMLAFTLSMAAISAHTMLLTDALAFFLIACSLYLYTLKGADWRMFLAAGAFAAAAFFIKLVIAFMAPALAVAYFWFAGERKTLAKPAFLLSLLLVPLAAGIEFMILQGAGLAQQLFMGDVLGHLDFTSARNPSGQRDLNSVLASIALTSPLPFLIPAAFGAWRHWRGNRFMALWLAFSVFPLYASVFQPWYHLPVMPAVGYFAVLGLQDANGNLRKKLFAAAVALSLALTALVVNVEVWEYGQQKQAGLILAGKENALILGMYAPGIVAYKMMEEQRTLGRTLDFGWILTPGGFSDLGEFGMNYRSDRYPVTEGSFGGMFTANDIIRKETNVTRFDYMAIASRERYEVSGVKMLLNGTYVQVYQRG